MTKPQCRRCTPISSTSWASSVPTLLLLASVLQWLYCPLKFMLLSL